MATSTTSKSGHSDNSGYSNPIATQQLNQRGLDQAAVGGGAHYGACNDAQVRGCCSMYIEAGAQITPRLEVAHTTALIMMHRCEDIAGCTMMQVRR